MKHDYGAQTSRVHSCKLIDMKRLTAIAVTSLAFVACGGNDKNVTDSLPVLTTTTIATGATTTTNPNVIDMTQTFVEEVNTTFGATAPYMTDGELIARGYTYCDAADVGMHYWTMLDTIDEGAEDEATRILDRAIATASLSYLCPQYVAQLSEPDLTDVDWSALGDIQAQEEAAAQQANIDAARAIYGQCGEWHDLAIEVGFTEDEWPWLGGVLFRESRCQPDAWNGQDAGLAQINKVHREWIESNGLTFPDAMFDPRHNLEFALALYRDAGCRPWRSSHSCPSN